jgi:hypothetical protein
MGFLKEINQFMIKYGEIALTKTDIFVQMIKLKIEIKKRTIEIDQIKLEAGEYTISRYEKKEVIDENVIKTMADRINIIRQELEELQFRLDSIKLQMHENGTELKNRKQA